MLQLQRAAAYVVGWRGPIRANPPAVPSPRRKPPARSSTPRAANRKILDAERAASELEAALRAAANPARAEAEKRYLKSELQHLGASMPAIRGAATAWSRAHPDLTRRELVALVDALWRVPIHERRMAAVELLDIHSALLTARDLALLERLIRDARTWALVDNLAASIAGPLVERFPQLGDTLDRWAIDEDFWVRRSALLALLLALRRGEGDFARFGRYADRMLEEREFFVRKAIGWVLRDTARKRPDLVYRWLRPRAARASGLTLREAAKALSEEQRAALLTARRRATRSPTA